MSVTETFTYRARKNEPGTQKTGKIMQKAREKTDARFGWTYAIPLQTVKQIVEVIKCKKGVKMSSWNDIQSREIRVV